MNFRELTPQEIVQLKRELLADTLLVLSEVNNVFKNGEVYHITPDESLKIVTQLDRETLFYISDRRFALTCLNINGNKVEFGTDVRYFKGGVLNGK